MLLLLGAVAWLQSLTWSQACPQQEGGPPSLLALVAKGLFHPLGRGLRHQNKTNGKWPHHYHLCETYQHPKREPRQFENKYTVKTESFTGVTCSNFRVIGTSEEGEGQGKRYGTWAISETFYFLKNVITCLCIVVDTWIHLGVVFNVFTYWLCWVFVPARALF